MLQNTLCPKLRSDIIEEGEATLKNKKYKRATRRGGQAANEAPHPSASLSTFSPDNNFMI